MPVKVVLWPDGPYAVADTPAEAVELLKLMGNGARSSHKLRPADIALVEQATEEKAFSMWLAEIKDTAKVFLSHLAKHKNGVEAGKLTEETGIASEKFGGVLGAASKRAEKRGLEMKGGIFVSEMRLDGPRRYRFYQPGPLLLKYADRLRISV